jgi:radical SAM protein with 4Fe4S-binding SPASM domain
MCNYRCVFCFQTNKDFTKKSNGYMGHMTLDIFKRTVDQVEGNIEFISLASRGEPLSCPDIEKMLIYAKGKFLNLKINTNASLLNERKSHAILQNDVRTLVFSADAADSELYSSLRVNGKLSKVVSNIKQFKKIREKNYPHSKIITRVSGVKVSEKQNYKDMEKFWGNLADQVAFVDYCPWENVYNRVKNTITAPCSELWRRMYIWCDGKTNPCEVDYRSELSTGYIANNNISKLWKSVSYNKLRQNHKSKLRNAVSPCNRCSVV